MCRQVKPDPHGHCRPRTTLECLHSGLIVTDRRAEFKTAKTQLIGDPLMQFSFKKKKKRQQSRFLKGSVLNAKVICFTLGMSTRYFAPDIYTRNSTPNTFFYLKTKKHFICHSPYKQIMPVWYFQVKCAHLNFKLNMFSPGIFHAP